MDRYPYDPPYTYRQVLDPQDSLDTNYIGLGNPIPHGTGMAPQTLSHQQPLQQPPTSAATVNGPVGPNSQPITFYPLPVGPASGRSQEGTTNSSAQDAQNIQGTDANDRPRRRRNKHACDQCRTKKAKCDGALPCGPCVNSNLSCAYSTPKKRGIPSGYLEKLEKTNDRLLNILALVTRSMENGEEYVQSLVAQWGNSGGDDDKSTDSAPRKVLSDEFLDAIQVPILTYMSAHKHSGSTGNSGAPASGATNTSGQPSSGRAPSIEDQSDTEEVLDFGPSSGFDNSFIASFERLHLTQPTFNIESWSRLVKPYNMMELLEYYFAYFHSLFPMVDKQALIKLAENTSTEEKTVKKSAQTCMLWSAAILGYHYVKSEKSSAHLAQILHNVSISALECRHTVETVQALLIQSFYYLARGFWSNAWMVTGNAIRISMELGIQVYNVAMPVSTRRTWKFCCIMDTFISGRIGRVPQIRASDYFDVDEDLTSEEYELWTPAPYSPHAYSMPSHLISTFNHVMKLSRLSNVIISQTNKAGWPGEMSVEEKMAFLNGQAQELTAWYSACPDYVGAHRFLVRREPQDLNRITPQQAQLLLGYVTVMSILIIAGAGPEYCNTAEQLYFICRNSSEAYNNMAPPSFEYFYAICTSAVLKLFLESEAYLTGRIKLRDYEPFTWLLARVHECSRIWDGLTVTYEYFQKILMSDTAQEDALSNVPYFTPPPIGMSSLQNILKYPDYS